MTLKLLKQALYFYLKIKLFVYIEKNKDFFIVVTKVNYGSW